MTTVKKKNILTGKLTSPSANILGVTKCYFKVSYFTAFGIFGEYLQLWNPMLYFSFETFSKSLIYIKN